MEQIKNILILSTQDPYRSSGIGAYDIFNSLSKNKGYNVKLLVETYKSYYEKDILCIKSSSKDFRDRIERKLLNRVRIKEEIKIDPDYHFHKSKKEYSTKKILKRIGFKPDLIIVFFAQDFISFKNFKELQSITKAPIIWQFADMRPFTGGCHYAWECDGYTRLCESCPALIDDQDKKFTYFELKKNHELIKDLNITAVIGSDWLIQRAKQSTLFKDKKIKKIFLPLDSSFFKPLNTSNNLKKKYGLSMHKKIILVAANYLHHKRKGVLKIFEALDILAKKDTMIEKTVELFIVGHELEKIKSKLPKRISYVYSDYIERNSLPEIYNVSDIFISASLQDVGPYTIAESLLCKTPVVSFNTGYANDFVNDKTGFLVNEISSSALAKGIEKLLNYESKNLNDIKNNARQIVIDKASPKYFSNEYNKLINDLMNE